MSPHSLRKLRLLAVALAEKALQRRPRSVQPAQHKINKTPKISEPKYHILGIKILNGRKSIPYFWRTYKKKDHKIIFGVSKFGILCQKIRFLCLPKLLFGVWHAWFDVRWYVVLWFGMVWYGLVWFGMVWYGGTSSKTPTTDWKHCRATASWHLWVLPL